MPEPGDDLFSVHPVFRSPESRIISASRRTDIPAFFAEWFESRLKAGYCEYPNPLYPAKLHRVSLRPEDMDGVFFWTRFGTPVAPSLTRLEKNAVPYAFLWTVNNYPAFFESNARDLNSVCAAFREISARNGRENIAWRYDPLILSPSTDISWHRENFRKLSGLLAPYCSRLIVSVVEPYPEARKTGGIIFDRTAYTELLQFIADESADAGLRVQSCAMEVTAVSGIIQGACIDGSILERQYDGRSIRRRHHKAQRANCMCHQSTDIGSNSTCRAGCAYCYARKIR